uniref:Uncharacterized protein n=1 Tax=Anguilla anguilla TaxID=7936 RepID=A0A0E9W719_ANGAN
MQILVFLTPTLFHSVSIKNTDEFSKMAIMQLAPMQARTHALEVTEIDRIRGCTQIDVTAV